MKKLLITLGLTVLFQVEGSNTGFDEIAQKIFSKEECADVLRTISANPQNLTDVVIEKIGDKFSDKTFFARFMQAVCEYSMKNGNKRIATPLFSESMYQFFMPYFLRMIESRRVYPITIKEGLSVFISAIDFRRPTEELKQVVLKQEEEEYKRARAGQETLYLQYYEGFSTPMLVPYSTSFEKLELFLPIIQATPVTKELVNQMLSDIYAEDSKTIPAKIAVAMVRHGIAKEKIPMIAEKIDITDPNDAAIDFYSSYVATFRSGDDPDNIFRTTFLNRVKDSLNIEIIFEKIKDNLENGYSVFLEDRLPMNRCFITFTFLPALEKEIDKRVAAKADKDSFYFIERLLCFLYKRVKNQNEALFMYISQNVESMLKSRHIEKYFPYIFPEVFKEYCTIKVTN